MYLENYYPDPNRLDYSSYIKAQELFKAHVLEGKNKPRYSVVYLKIKI
jgi:hypothetical protein